MRACISSLDRSAAGDGRAVHGISLRKRYQDGTAVLGVLLDQSIRATRLYVRGERADACIAYHSIEYDRREEYDDDGGGGGTISSLKKACMTTTASYQDSASEPGHIACTTGRSSPVTYHNIRTIIYCIVHPPATAALSQRRVGAYLSKRRLHPIPSESTNF